MDLGKRSEQLIGKLYQDRKHVELTIGTLKDGRTEVCHWGPNREEKNDEVLIYPAGSFCKLFTTAMLAKYVAERKLDLDAPLSRYIQPLPDQYYPNLRKLATHSSGYSTQPYNTLYALKMLIRMNKPDGIFRVNPYHGAVNEADMRRLLSETHLKDRTYKFQYSNFGLGILGWIVGAVSGQGYWDGIQAYILEKLGLKNTSLGNTDMLGYDKKDQPCHCWPWDKEDVVAAAGALLSSMEDLLKFAQLQMDGSKPYLSLCHQEHGAGEKTFTSGLAWRLEKGTNISWHDGAAGAYSAFIGLDREKKTAVSIAVNYGLLDTKELAFSILNEL